MVQNITLADRIVRSLFVALAVGMAWGIRGDFGGVMGAMFPGACLGLGFAYVSGQREAWRWMPGFGAISAVAIGQGGSMSYGILHGYAKSDTFINYTYGYFTLLLQGGAWGAFGGAILGLLMERRRPTALQWISLAATVWVCGFLLRVIIVNGFDFHINPPRGNTSITFTGGVIGMIVWLSMTGFRHGLKGALLGWLGFGLGMAGGRALGNASYHLPWDVNHWNIMEVMCGFIGGFVYTFGMLGRRFEPLPATRQHAYLAFLSAFLVMTVIQLMHVLSRDMDRRIQWADNLVEYGLRNPTATASHIYFALLGLVVVAGVTTLLWYYLWRRDAYRWGALPIVALCGFLLIIQNLNALRFWYPPREDFINMHNVIAGMYVLMLVYVVFEAVRRKPPAIADDTATEHIPWGRWAATAAGAFLLIIISASVVNGEETHAIGEYPLAGMGLDRGTVPGRGVVSPQRHRGHRGYLLCTRLAISSS